MAGVSGGADSVCLLLVLSALKKEIPYKLLVVHINHKIRKEAGWDAAFVKDLCERYQVPFFLVEEDVEALAKEKGISTEEAGRQVRYQAFDTVLRENAPEAVQRGKAKIAVAHNLNDRAETMLFHLFRGSGLNGLGSIRPVKERQGLSTIIRPLLGLPRSEIEAFLSEKEMCWCIDSTNDEDTYTRNKIRHHILPYAQESVSCGAVTNMGRAAEILAETEDFVQKEMRKAYAECVTEIYSGESVGDYGQNKFSNDFPAGQQIVFSVQKFLSYHPLLQKQMLLHCLERLTPARKDITATHVEDMLSLFTKEGNRSIHLPYGLVARREYEKVMVEERTSDIDILFKNGISVHLPKPGEVPLYVPLFEREGMEFSVFSYEKSMNIPQNEYTKWFDYDKMSKSLTIRTRRTGDYFTFNAALSKKSVQDYMVEAKIPKGKRDDVPILADGQQVLWIVGYRIGSSYKVDEQTKHILQVRLRGEQ